MEEGREADQGAGDESEAERVLLLEGEEEKEKERESKGRGKVALVGEDVEVPEAAGDLATVVGGKSRKFWVGEDEFEAIQGPTVFGKEIIPTGGTVEEKEEKTDEAGETTLEESFAEKIDEEGEKSEAGDTW